MEGVFRNAMHANVQRIPSEGIFRLHGWKDVKEQIDHNVNLVLFQAPAGDNYTFDVNWSQLYGKLEPGEYRIVKPYQKGEAFSRDGETFYAFAEFTVGEK